MSRRNRSRRLNQNNIINEESNEIILNKLEHKENVFNKSEHKENIFNEASIKQHDINEEYIKQDIVNENLLSSSDLFEENHELCDKSLLNIVEDYDNSIIHLKTNIEDNDKSEFQRLPVELVQKEFLKCESDKVTKGCMNDEGTCDSDLDNWINIEYLDIKYKKIVNKYFKNKPDLINSKFKIIDNTLKINIKNWGIEYFYIDDINKNTKFYEISYENINNIYDLAICIQIGNWDIFRKMESYIHNLNKININYYFTIIDEYCTNKNINYLITNYKNSVILKNKNKGMDIGLFFSSLHYIKINNINHNFLIKIHTKTDDNTRNKILNNLLSSHNKIINNIKLLTNSKNGMIAGNTIYEYHSNPYIFMNNIYHLNDISNYLYNENIDNNKLKFVETTMFIIKQECLRVFTISNIEYIYYLLNDFHSIDYSWYAYHYNLDKNNKKGILLHYFENPNDRYLSNLNFQFKTNQSNLRDCMIEHGLERFFGYMCIKEGLEIVST